MQTCRIILALSALAGCGTENTLQTNDGTDGAASPTGPSLPPEEPEAEEEPLPPAVVDEQVVEDCQAGGFAVMNGETGYPTIDAAVDDSVAGDELLICPGTYHRSNDLRIPRSLSLRAADPTPGATVLGFGLVLLGDDDLLISGLTLDLRLGYASGVGFSTSAANTGGGSVTVEDTVFELGDEHNGGIGMDVSIHTTVRRSRFSGGIHSLRPQVSDGARFLVEVSDTLMEHAHGAIQIDGPGELRLDGVTFDQSGGCGAITVTVGPHNPLGNTEPVDIIAKDTAFIATRAEPSFVFPIGAAVSFRVEDSFTCTGCTWTDNDPHDLLRDNEVFDQPSSDVAL